VQLQDVLFHFIEHYGYYALFVLLAVGILGVPIPDEFLMTFVGSLSIPGGPFQYPIAVTTALAGSFVGMLVSYLLGSKVGKPFLYRHGKWIKLSPNRIEKVEGWFQKYGLWTVFFGYWLPGVRHFTCYFAGVMGIRLWKYVAVTSLGAMLWCSMFITIGHIIGRNFEPLLHHIHSYMLAVLFTAISIIAIIGYWYFRTDKRSKTM
jgi:membrane protein DedA with SNARE-associated domain